MHAVRDIPISVEAVETRFGAAVIHRGISFTVEPGKVISLIGASGGGKTVLLKEMLGLLRPTAGRILLFGTDMYTSDEMTQEEVKRRFGVLFQNSALFSSLTAGQNVALPIKEKLPQIPESLVEELVRLRLSMTGLAPETASKMPSELSGGMRKRVALARALVMEPELLFLDEPTSGLDPINAREFDRLVRTLCDSLGLTVFMVTHDLDSILGITDRLIVLEHGKVIADGAVPEVASSSHPWIQEYFSSRAEVDRAPHAG